MQTKAVMLNARSLDFDKILDFDPIELVAKLTIHDNLDPKLVAVHVRGFSIVISKEYPLDSNIVESLPDEVRLICEAGTGYDNIDTVATGRKKIVVCNVPGYSTHSVAQLTMCLVLCLSNSIHRLVGSVSAGDFNDFHGGLRFHNSEVHGKTLGVIGAGSIGQQVILLARAFRMNVLVYNRSPREWDDDLITQVDLQELLRKSDFVALHCPLNDETSQMISVNEFEMMKDTAFLINTARGPLVDEDALVDALKSKQIAGAGLDVQAPEPPDDDSELWLMNNVILTPHMGWKALEARQRLIQLVADNIKAYLNGSPINVVGESHNN